MAQIISEYRKGARYLRLSFDGKSYSFEGNGCGGGYALGTPREEAIAQFESRLASQPVRLEHHSGQKLRNLHDECKEGSPMTTADMKRRFAEGTRWNVSYRDPARAVRNRVITIAKRQSADFKDDGNVWHSFVRSDRLRDLGNGAVLVTDSHTGEPNVTYTPA